MRAFTGGLLRILQKLDILCAIYLLKSVNFILMIFCLKPFGELKEKLVSAPIIISPHWSRSLEMMCDVVRLLLV